MRHPRRGSFSLPQILPENTAGTSEHKRKADKAARQPEPAILLYLLRSVMKKLWMKNRRNRL
jgi:hypothetical protein